MLELLRARFERNAPRHPDVAWSDVLSRIETRPEALRSLSEMERTGGEPDVIAFQGEGLAFVDCSPETPAGRRSLCYDDAALDARKEHKPKGSTVAMAEAMGIELLTEEQYRTLQTLGEFDLKTSSWIATPPEVRRLGGALFADRRYDRVFVFHNGAESYYASRGFRSLLRL